MIRRVLWAKSAYCRNAIKTKQKQNSRFFLICMLVLKKKKKKRKRFSFDKEKSYHEWNKWHKNKDS